MAKMVRNIVEVEIQVAGQIFVERGTILASNTEKGREFAKGFVAQDYLQQHSSPDYQARLKSARILKATFEECPLYQGEQ